MVGGLLPRLQPTILAETHLPGLWRGAEGDRGAGRGRGGVGVDSDFRRGWGGAALR